MHTESLERWLHDHTFGQDRKKTGENRTLIVIGVTALTMGVEIVAGIAFGSMALLADGLHMASHASALSIAAFAYSYTRRRARDPRFNFGAGKVNSLAAFAGALLLALFAAVMAWESVERFISPSPIRFNQAILVAVLGLIVNGACLAILGGHDRAHEEKDAAGADLHHDHEHSFEGRDRAGHGGHARSAPEREHKDHNLLAAYLHVMADALTSALAIFALLAGKFLNQQWLDPFMGLVGAVLVTRWSLGLLKASARTLLDMQAPEGLRREIEKAIESAGDDRISDLHVWSVGPGIYAMEMCVVSSHPLDAGAYHELLPKTLGLAHATIETRRCEGPALEQARL